ncbi:aspartate/glutamate racemase family protein [Kitasatospora sp. NPDC091207]|uniref:aspartate/glutamate racemase family protein n=1 Tax=Kitasatospora sp. NPDC091207 TaxID=3364083 RepID=UPI0037FEB631
MKALAQRLGVIGGVGPVATVEFYRSLIEQVRRRTGASPDLVIHSLPIPVDLELAVLAGNLTDPDRAHITNLLTTALNTLEHAGCRTIAMPCNSFHPFLRPLLTCRPLTLIDMVEATIETAAAHGLKRVLLLATGTSLNGAAYAAATDHGIELIEPPSQTGIDQLLERCVGGDLRAIDLDALRTALHDVPDAQGVLLGCTDLTVLRDALTPLTPVVDSLDCLVEACAAALAPTDRTTTQRASTC